MKIGFAAALTLVVLCGSFVTPAQTSRKPSFSCPSNNPQRNKQLVLNAYKEVINGGKYDQMERYWAKDYIQHNPGIPDGLEPVRTYLRSSPDRAQVKTTEVLRTAADGDLVFAHVKVVPKNPSGPVVVIADIFRIECGLLKEHWDAVQVANTTGPRITIHSSKLGVKINRSKLWITYMRSVHMI